MSDDRDRMGQPPIEPLGDLPWARIERAVWAELDATTAPAAVAAPARNRRVAWFAAGAAAAVAAAVIAFVAIGRDGPAAPAASSTANGPQWVVTGDGASSVTFGDAQVKVAPRSAIVMSGSADGGVLVVIDRGAAEFEVAPRAGRPRFVVQAGAVSVRVIGTGFRVERTGDRAEVTVTHGVVEVVAPGETTRVGAGESWPREETATAASAANVAAPDAGIDMEPIAVDRDRDRDRNRAPHAKTPAPHAAGSAPPEPPAPPATTTDQDARRFAAAAAVEAGDPSAALAEYRRLAAGDGPWAANALYAAARLLYERRDDDAARAALADYLHRFPRGANSADARALMSKLQGATR